MSEGQAVVSVNLSAPIAGLSAAELARFRAGQTEFEDVEDAADGLGPIFNEASCATCHDEAGTGGGGTRVETRFGNTVNGIFDPLVSKGGSLLQDHSLGRVSAQCPWIGFDAVPANANTVAQRRTTPLFGLGLVDATPDATFTSLAAQQRQHTPGTAGRPNMVANLDKGGAITVGKFGWKSQVPTLHQFAGDAYLNEMGVTSPQFPTENCPNGDCSKMSVCNPVPTLNDDGSGPTAFTDFMQFLAPPSRGTITSDVTTGEATFNAIGCASCHVATLTSGSGASSALSNKTYHPYSDFLLHDMGTSGDGIGAMGQASTTEMRTAPLWGLRARSTFLHGGNAVSIREAVERHRGQGESARFAFDQLGTTQMNQVLAFLGSL
jgi:CxxC motif-containing protein (DUF1111 family)